MDSSSPIFDDDERDIHEEEEEFLTPESNRRGKKKQTRNIGSESEKPESKSPKILNPRSNVWQHFTRLKDNSDKGSCNYCGKELCSPTKSGTKTLWNYLKICKAHQAWVESQNPSEGQQVINKHENLQSGKVPEHILREALNEMVVIGELPLSFVEGMTLKHFCNKVNLYKPHSRRTVVRDVVKMFHERKSTLKKWFLTTKQRVSLTTDIWVSSVTGSSYMVITAHYIDKNWRLKKLIIGFKHVEDHRGKTIANTLLKCLAEWGIERLFTITVDNATANTSALSQFQSAFSLISEDSLVLDGDFMHLRCAGHIINLIVKDGLTEIDSSVAAVRNGISYVRGGPNRRKSFQLRVDYGKFSKGSLPLDVCTRWNSKFMMLTSAIKFKGAFDRMEFEDKLYSDHFLETENGVKRIGPPQKDDWHKVERLVKFLNVFYHATFVVFASTTMNAFKCYGEIVKIAVKLRLLCHNVDNEVKVNAQKMFDKFDKYWDGLQNINKLLVIVSVFDPRKKMQYGNLCFEELYGEESLTAKSLYDSALNIIRDMYKEYSARSNAAANEELSQSQSSTQNTQERQREDEFDGYNPVDHKYDTLLKRIGVRNTNELDTYLREEVENPDLMMGIEYDVLSWWKVNSGKYPILSKMARDLFAMQVSSVASESAFSTSGRIFNPYRSCRTHYMVEILICTEQWLKQDLKFEDTVLTNAQILADFEFEDELEREYETSSEET